MGSTIADHPSTDSGALIGSNDDLLTEILRRLPVTSVLRFKSVSKHWRSLLSHRRFTLLYNSASTSPGFFIYNLYIPFDDENRSTPPLRDLDFYPDPYRIQILQSCNGLLFCCSDRRNYRDRSYYVFNPTTKQFAIIPPVPVAQDGRVCIWFMVLAFHQTESVHYKIVCFYSAKPYLYQIQIYSSDTGKWKISDQSFTSGFFVDSISVVYWNGAIHWDPFCCNPLYFKLDEEQLLAMPIPKSLDSIDSHYRSLYFGESRGHLHLVERASKTPLLLNIYEMASDHSGWFVKYRVEMDELPHAYPEMVCIDGVPHDDCCRLEVIDVIRGEKEEETFMLLQVFKKFIRYNLADKSFKEIFDLRDASSDRIRYATHTNIHRYIESLASF